ncbi:MAG: hypothetical protein AVDCRST_MAG11-3459, partial [uncultured Gemmatimonadaceae bacterium]
GAVRSRGTRARWWTWAARSPRRCAAPRPSRCPTRRFSCRPGGRRGRSRSAAGSWSATR